MKTHFIYEAAIGIIGIIAVFIFGNKGGAVLALMALEPFLPKSKFDEEIKILYRKTNKFTLIPFCILLALMFIFFNQQINGHIIKNICVWLFAYSLLLSHGCMGFVFFMNKKTDKS
jgi:hypothetical protein